MNCPVADDGIRGKNEKYGENPKQYGAGRWPVAVRQRATEPRQGQSFWLKKNSYTFFRLKADPRFEAWKTNKDKKTVYAAAQKEYRHKYNIGKITGRKQSAIARGQWRRRWCRRVLSYIPDICHGLIWHNRQKRNGKSQALYSRWTGWSSTAPVRDPHYILRAQAEAHGCSSAI